MAFGKKTNTELLQNEQNRRDVGFGTTITNSNSRLLNKDGSFNVRRINTDFWARADVFNRLIAMTWPKFFGLVFVFYFMVNLAFSLIYIGIGVEHLQGVDLVDPVHRFWGAFFFSAQTLTTVGYGHIAPKGVMTSSVAAIEALVGLLGFALATGLLYGRFSRPKPNILFSRKALIAPYLETNAFMFRIINQSPNELIEVGVEITLSRLEVQPNGQPARKYYPLALERAKINFFPLNWTVVHAITEESPFWNMNESTLRTSDTEILIYIKAIEEKFLQNIQVRHSYRFDEVFWGGKFKSVFDVTQNDVVIDVKKIHDFDQVPLN